MASSSASDLQKRLANLFGRVLFDLSNVSQRRTGSIAISVCDIRYKEDVVPNEPTRPQRVVEQTLVVLGSEQLNLPEFAATPQRGGMLRSLVTTLIGDLGNIEFEDDPQFSNSVHLHGWNETAVRALFTPQVRGFLVAHPDFVVRGKDQQIAIFKPNRIIRHDELSEVVETALELLRQLPSGGEAQNDALHRSAAHGDVGTHGKDTAPNILFTLGFLLLMPLIGGTMAAITGWYRARKSRVLRDGQLFSGTITDVTQSNLSVNQQIQHVVRISFPNDEKDGIKREVICAAYSLGADQAQQFHQNQQPVRLLVDPRDPNHIVCVDLITLFD